MFFYYVLQPAVPRDIKLIVHFKTATLPDSVIRWLSNNAPFFIVKETDTKFVNRIRANEKQ